MNVNQQFSGTTRSNNGIYVLPHTTFEKDILEGLTSYPKTLPSKYFYDQKGDKIFQQIMQIEEYYLTRAEYNIFEYQAEAILDTLGVGTHQFHLLEFGAGDGYKTKVLLRHFLEERANFKYCPIDISDHVLKILTDSLVEELPDLTTEALHGDYFQVLQALKSDHDHRKVVMFLGSNIGNFTQARAESFLTELSSNLNPGDMLLIGIDLKKDPRAILAAYDDPHGITKAFNFNLLDRINRELGADFRQALFKHYVTYDPQTGECRSYLMSTEQQQITFASGQRITIDAWEPIHTETSKKYSLPEIEALAEHTGFTVKRHFTDENQYFVDSIWQVK